MSVTIESFTSDFNKISQCGCSIDDVIKEARRYKCNYCPQAFFQLNHLIAHIRQHTEQTKYEPQKQLYNCDICSKSFIEVEDLVAHINVHIKEINEKNKSKEEPYKCDYCPKTFSHMDRLASHIRMHTGGIEFQCKECPKSFNDKSALISHRRFHTARGFVQCACCFKQFTQKIDLARHLEEQNPKIKVTTEIDHNLHPKKDIGVIIAQASSTVKRSNNNRKNIIPKSRNIDIFSIMPFSCSLALGLIMMHSLRIIKNSSLTKLLEIHMK